MIDCWLSAGDDVEAGGADDGAGVMSGSPGAGAGLCPAGPSSCLASLSAGQSQPQLPGLGCPECSQQSAQGHGAALTHTDTLTSACSHQQPAGVTCCRQCEVKCVVQGCEESQGRAGASHVK